MRRVGVKRTDSESSDVAALTHHCEEEGRASLFHGPYQNQTLIHGMDRLEIQCSYPRNKDGVFHCLMLAAGFNFLRRVTSGVWGAVDYIKKSFREWRRPPPLCPSPPPVASSTETRPTPQTTPVQDGWSESEHHRAGPLGRQPSPPSSPSLYILTPVRKTTDQRHSASSAGEKKTEAPANEMLRFSSQIKQQKQPREQQQQPSVLRELQQTREREQYNQILFGRRHTYSPSSPPRSPSLFTPLLHPEVIGPTSPRYSDTVELSRHTYTAPHFHSTPSHPLPHPPHSSTSSHQPVLHSSSSARPLSSSHHPKATSTTDHSWTFLAARGGSRTQDYGQEKPRVPLQHSSWERGSQHGAPSDHHSLQHNSLTAKGWSSRGVQTSSTKADPSSVVSRQWLENLKLDHKHAVEDRKALEEVFERYAHLCREDRRKMEKARVERVRRDLGLITVEEEPAVQEMNLKLTPEQNEKVTVATGRGSGTECLSERFRIRISRSDLFTLTGLQWLNDEIINFYFNLIAERSSSSKLSVHVMSSFFYPKLTQAGYSGVRRWTKKVDLFAKDVILIPIHLGMHWCLATVHFSQNQFQYFDSLQGNNPSCLARLRDYLLAEAKDKKQMDYDVSGWTYYTPKNIPDQRNGSDCGVFTCMYARYIASDVPFTFSQNDMPRIREHMICEILEQRLF